MNNKLDREGIEGEREEREERGKRGRKKKIESGEIKNEEAKEKEDTGKYFVDVSGDAETWSLVKKLLKEANNKTLGRKIKFNDLAVASLPKLTSKDIERIQENAMSFEDILRKFCMEQNEKNNTKVSDAEILVRKLNLLKT